MSKYLTTASNELEAEIVLARLHEAGVEAWESNSLGGRPGSAGPRDIYIDDQHDPEQARAVPKAAEESNEKALALLGEESAPPPE